MNEEKLDALLNTIQSLDDRKPYFRGLIYGDTGVGKTVLACTVGTKRLIVESDPEGWVSLINHPALLEGTERMQYKGLSQLDAFIEAYLSGDSRFTQYDTLIVDTASDIAFKDLDTVLKTRSAKDINKDPNVPTQPDFYANTERMRRTFSQLLELPMHIVMTSHAREDKDERTGVMYTRPGFTPKLSKTLQQKCHLVGFLTAVEQSSEGKEADYHRRLQVHPTRSITAKSRIGGLPVVIDNPDLGSIVDSWVASGGSEDDLTTVVADALGVDGPSVIPSSELEI